MNTWNADRHVVARCGEVVDASLTHRPLRSLPFTFSHSVLPLGPYA